MMDKQIDTNIAELEQPELNDIDNDSDNDSHISEPVIRTPEEPTSFKFGEQRIKISHGLNEVECHFTNSNPEQTCNLALQMFE